MSPDRLGRHFQGSAPVAPENGEVWVVSFRGHLSESAYDAIAAIGGETLGPPHGGSAHRVWIEADSALEATRLVSDALRPYGTFRTMAAVSVHVV